MTHARALFVSLITLMHVHFFTGDRRAEDTAAAAGRRGAAVFGARQLGQSAGAPVRRCYPTQAARQGAHVGQTRCAVPAEVSGVAVVTAEANGLDSNGLSLWFGGRAVIASVGVLMGLQSPFPWLLWWVGLCERSSEILWFRLPL